MRADGGPVDLGGVEDLAIGEIRGVDSDDGAVVLCRSDEDEFALVDGACTHQRVALCDGGIVDGTIECPKHNGRFNLQTGAAVRGPVVEPLKTYPVEIVDGRITAWPNRAAK